MKTLKQRIGPESSGKSSVTVSPQNKTYEGLARRIAAPIILRLLAQFDGQQLAQAINTDFDLVGWLHLHEADGRRLQVLVQTIPYARSALPHLKEREWVNWFIQTQLPEHYNDLYLQFQYQPEGIDWLQRTLTRLVDYLLGSP